MKVVINRCYGGFSLSEAAYEFLNMDWDGFGFAEKFVADRSNPELVKCVETLGPEKASGKFSALRVVDIPDDVDWDIADYDGIEHVEERHRVWF